MRQLRQYREEYSEEKTEERFGSNGVYNPRSLTSHGVQAESQDTGMRSGERKSIINNIVEFSTTTDTDPTGLIRWIRKNQKDPLTRRVLNSEEVEEII